MATEANLKKIFLRNESQIRGPDAETECGSDNVFVKQSRVQACASETNGVAPPGRIYLGRQ